MAAPVPGNELEDAIAPILDEVADETVSPHALEFRPINPAPVPRGLAAVDGGSSVVLDARTSGLYAVRAGYTIRSDDDRFLDRIPTKAYRTVTRRGFLSAWEGLRKLYAWGVVFETPALEPMRLVPCLADDERSLAEYNAARRALLELRRGDLLLLDGSLDSEERLGELRISLLERAREAGIPVASVTKDSTRTIGGVLPVTMEMEELAVRRKVAAPWFVDVTEALGLADARSRVLVARFDARTPAYRVDVAGAPPEELVGALLECCNDAAYPGYPYPLARIHHRVHYEPGESADLRRDLEGIVARRRGHRLSLRLLTKGRDVLELAH